MQPIDSVIDSIFPEVTIGTYRGGVPVIGGRSVAGPGEVEACP